MMTATSAWLLSTVIAPAAVTDAAYRKPNKVAMQEAVMPRSSGDDVRNEAVLERLQTILYRQLLLLHSLYLEWIAGRRDHRIDRGVEVRVFLFQTSEFEANLCLFLFRHAVRLSESPVQQGAPGRESGSRIRNIVHTTFRIDRKCYYRSFDFVTK
jgi:hypothetical protein